MFSKIFKELREEKNITQKDLAKQLNITDRLIRYYETGERMPPSDILGRIADLFDVSVDYLLGRTKIKKPIDVIMKENFQNTSNDKESLNTKDLSSESQAELKKLIELYRMRDMQKRNTEVSDDLTNTD